MVSRNEKEVISNALEVYIWILRGESPEFAMKQRPYKVKPEEEDMATSLSVDDDVASSARATNPTSGA